MPADNSDYQDVIYLTYEQFEEGFEPIKNQLAEDAPYDGCMFETFGEELGLVKQADQSKVWTVVQPEEKVLVTNGYHRVNRIGYLITKRPYPVDAVYEVADFSA